MSIDSSSVRARDLASDGFLIRALAGISDRAETVVLCLPAPRAPLEVLIEQFPDEPFSLWAGPDDTGLIGFGAVHELKADGETRFDQLLSWCRKVSSEVLAQSYLAGPCPSPRLLGGVSFAPGSCKGPTWAGFSDVHFVLPRWTYLREEERAFLYLAVKAADARDKGQQARLAAEHGAIMARLENCSNGHRPPGRTAMASSTPSRVDQLSRERWRQQVDGVRGLIQSGAVKKIVTARRADVHLEQPRRLGQVLSRMAEDRGSCTRFALHAGRKTFLGLTPETLFRKSGGLFATHALAGTVCRGSDTSESAKAAHGQRLMTSDKDTHEHDLVVDEIRSRMQPLCSTLVYDSRPRLRTVRNLIHLETHFAGSLRGRTHAAELLSVLHPTPAIGGTPTREAVAWILANEAAPRGWYTGAIGWMDLIGDGVFSVSIRCGLLTEQYAHAFAGAGIVHSSDPEAEYIETAAKQEPFLWAVGVSAEDSCEEAAR